MLVRLDIYASGNALNFVTHMTWILMIELLLKYWLTCLFLIGNTSNHLQIWLKIYSIYHYSYSSNLMNKIWFYLISTTWSCFVAALSGEFGFCFILISGCGITGGCLIFGEGKHSVCMFVQARREVNCTKEAY